MDVLKVLTRSTSLGKRKARHNALVGNLPSSGAPSHPQALAESTSATTKKASRGVKRKRGGMTNGHDANGIPNFFDSLTGPSSKQHDDEDAEVEEEADVIPVPQISETSQSQVLTMDECKALLRRHKLKVHVVRAGVVKKSKESKSKKRKIEAQRKKPATFEAIYPQPIQSFKELRQTQISKRLLRNLDQQGYTVPTEVQMAALSIFLSPENDLLDGSENSPAHVDMMTAAPTGSGKTLAFLIPIMNRLLAEKVADESERHVRAIVLAPTHELADQIVNEARKLAEGTGLRAAAMQKGMRLHQGPEKEDEDGEEGEGLIKSDIVVSTPQVMANSLQSGESKPDRTLARISHFVLDEADVLLDPMFREQTMKTWNACTLPSLRVSLWSATMGASIETLATDYILERLQKVSKDERRAHKLVRVIVGLKDSAIPNVRHHLTYAATEQGKLLAMRQLLHPSTNTTSDPTLRPPFLVFAQTIPRAVALHSELLYDLPAEAGGSARIAVLHSDLSLSARSDIMAKFRRGEIWVLITTDLLSRGVDFRGVNGVVNYDIPTSGAGYVHRAGRTGRAGREGGVCVTLYTQEDIPYVKNVANVIAAAEKLKGKKLGDDGTAMPQWLLDALPDLSKGAKKDLKRRGVAARRSEKGGKSDGKGKMRISTKSGYDRKLEHRRRTAKWSQRGEGANSASDDGGEASDGFGGFDD